MKSALELAMEKANQISGQTKHLTENQKNQIAEIRNVTEAKVAEAKIMLDDTVAKLPDGKFDPDAKKAIEEFQIEKGRIERAAEDKIEKIRAG